MRRDTVSIKLDPSLWKEVKHRCIDTDMDYSVFVELALKDFLRRKGLKAK